MKKNTFSENSYKFLKNQPLGEDLFENKSQEKIATVIGEKIINEPNFKIIGIDGQWGSGKSNLVKLLEKELADSHKFFVYDVWGHQEDDQRKSILTELTDFITSTKIVDDQRNWKEKLLKLTSRQKNTTTTNIPHLSIGFIISLLLIIYVPTVNTFSKNLPIFWKLVLVLLPIIVLFVLLIYYFFSEKKKYKLKNKEEYSTLGMWLIFKKFSFEATQQLFKIYTNSKVDESKVEIVSENEPTVKEFRSWMKEIDNDLTTNIVIVFDNFDRLPKQHILNIWSSLHIFFAEEFYSKIKVIIPFDRSHVENAFDELNSKENSKVIKFGNDYVNKTFDIVFRITLPIMSDWKYFFKERWCEAFINYEEEEFRLVVQVYEFLNLRITPREIISFINEIITIKLLDSKFKERYIAIFVLRKNKILENPLKAVTELETVLEGLTSIYDNDPDYAKQLTAIVYHIEVDKALELIYRQELKDSLLKKDIELFNSICRADFIDSQFISVISEIELYENPIITLDKIEKNTKVSQQHINQAWNIFYNKVLFGNVQINKIELKEWQKIIINHSYDVRYLKIVLDGYYEVIVKDNSNLNEYLDIIKYIETTKFKNTVYELLKEIEIDAMKFITFIEKNGSEYKFCKLKTDVVELESMLSAYSIDSLIDFKNIEVLINDFSLDKTFRSSLIENINNSFKNKNIKNCTELFSIIKKFPLVEGFFNSNIANNFSDSDVYSLYKDLKDSDNSFKYDLISMRIVHNTSFHSSYQNIFIDILESDIEININGVANSILYYITFEKLLLLSKKFNNSKLFENVVKYIMMNNLSKRENDISEVVRSYKEIKDNLNINDNKLLFEINMWKFDAKLLSVEVYDQEFIDDCFLYNDLEISKVFIKYFNDEFLQSNEEAVDRFFLEEKSNMFKNFSKLDKSSLTELSLTAFEKVFFIKLKNNSLNQHWWKIFEIYDSNKDGPSITNTLKNIRDSFLNSNLKLELAVALQILPYFIKHDLLISQKEVFRLILKKSFLSDDDFVDLLIEHNSNIKEVFTKAEEDDKEGFRNLIIEKRAENTKFDELIKLLEFDHNKNMSEDDIIL